MKIISILLLLIILFGCTIKQAQNINIRDRTKCEEAPDLKIIECDVVFKPGGDIGYKVIEIPRIQIDITFKNIAPKQIRLVEFEILPFCKIANQEINIDLQQVNVQPYTYPDEVPPNKEGSFLYEPSVDGLTLPIKLIIRVSKIEYEDGTIWKRDETN